MMPPALLIAIDPALRCGLATFRDGAFVQAHVWDLAKADARPGYRYRRLRDLLAGLFASAIAKGIETRGILVAYERATFRGSSIEAAISKGGYYATILSVCEDHRVRVESYAPSTVKKTATGSGRADKDAVIRAVSERFGLGDIDDNTADAIAVGLTALRNYAPN